MSDEELSRVSLPDGYESEYDFVTWRDGSQYRCECAGRGPQVYALDPGCRAHEHVEHPERFPDEFCAKHKQWKHREVCDYCAREPS